MSLVLHRFPLSHFAEKVRACLDFKGLDYRVQDHYPGLGQIQVYRISGQRQVPVLEHDGKIITDSTEIALYLERTFPEGRRLLPEDQEQRGEVLALQDHIGKTLGRGSGLLAFLRADRDVRMQEALKLGTSATMFGVIKTVAFAARHARKHVASVEEKLGKVEQMVRASLTDLTRRLEASPYLTGDKPTLADIAAVTLVMPLKFPLSRHVANPRLMGLVGNPIATELEYARFFEWREQFYRDYLQ
ncbi:glutathione S-transferase family protein [Chondromyces apiculatus]|uniref:Glutathione S-transferase family protein n=1 Tax=Chondromyces apiculatus DSM 436 TaxID=1192034 RepID=A0A017T5P6_9BACT|nr:glutathione S-transferase family protein [Chondromyces apiculatus]EYF04115.1 Glutathione S-transferase family protein [Chondromyces apiculatus DSM 436]